jgi:hypothetical protein
VPSPITRVSHSRTRRTTAGWPAGLHSSSRSRASPRG